MYQIKQSSTANPLVFFMVDDTDHITGKTGLSPTVTLSKNGAAFGAPAGTVSEIADGWYKVAGNATDSNTLGPLILHATDIGADPTDALYAVTPEISGLLTANERNAIADAYLDRADAIETGLTPRNFMRVVGATAGGKNSGVGTGTEIYVSAVSGLKNRVSASIDVNSNRTAITYDFS